MLTFAEFNEYATQLADIAKDDILVEWLWFETAPTMLVWARELPARRIAMALGEPVEEIPERSPEYHWRIKIPQDRVVRFRQYTKVVTPNA